MILEEYWLVELLGFAQLQKGILVTTPNVLIDVFRYFCTVDPRFYEHGF